MSDAAPSLLSVSIRPQPGAPAHTWQVSLPSTFVETYEVGELIGVGGMGSVYSAVQRSTGRNVAIKFMKHPYDEEAVARFLREARVLARLSHPGILRVFDCGEVESTLYMVTELHPGGSLRSLIDDGARPPAREAVRLTAEVLDALEICHAAGVVHRDLKPGNVLLSEDRRAVVADFGLARWEVGEAALTVAGALIGTPMYMAAEQIAGKPAGPPTDLYAAGAMLFEMLVGRPPRALALGGFWDGSAEALERAAPDAPPGVRAVLLSALSDEPRHRPASAADMARGLRAGQNPSRPTHRVPPAEVATPRAASDPVAGGNRRSGPAAGGDRRTAKLSGGQGHGGAPTFAAAALVALGLLIMGVLFARQPAPAPPPPQPGPSPGPEADTATVERLAALERLARACPADLHEWLVRAVGPRLHRGRDLPRPALLAMFRENGLHPDLGTLLDGPAPDPRVSAAERVAWANAGWIELLERTFMTLHVRWPYARSFIERLDELWPRTSDLEPVDGSWETHVRGVVDITQDLRFARPFDGLIMKRLWFPYRVLLSHAPRQARVWFAMNSPRANHAVMARFKGNRVVVLGMPRSSNPRARPLELVPASVRGERMGQWNGDRLTVKLDVTTAPPCYLGREIPAAWLEVGPNTMEITTAMLDATDTFETGAALWLKALSIK